MSWGAGLLADFLEALGFAPTSEVTWWPLWLLLGLGLGLLLRLRA